MGLSPDNHPSSGPDRGRESDAVHQEWLAARLLAGMRARAVRNRAIGVLQASTGCDRGQAQAYLDTEPGGGQRAAAKVMGMVEADAERGTDPDAFWDGFGSP
jgi:hypothetical protein